MIFAILTAPLVDELYALTRPPAPSLIPPKYLVTTAKTLVNSFFCKTSKITTPAVWLGSPSSEAFIRLVPSFCDKI